MRAVYTHKISAFSSGRIETPITAFVDNFPTMGEIICLDKNPDVGTYTGDT